MCRAFGANGVSLLRSWQKPTSKKHFFRCVAPMELMMCRSYEAGKYQLRKNISFDVTLLRSLPKNVINLCSNKKTGLFLDRFFKM